MGTKGVLHEHGARVAPPHHQVLAEVAQGPDLSRGQIMRPTNLPPAAGIAIRRQRELRIHWPLRTRVTSSNLTICNASGEVVETQGSVATPGESGASETRGQISGELPGPRARAVGLY